MRTKRPHAPPAPSQLFVVGDQVRFLGTTFPMFALKTNKAYRVTAIDRNWVSIVDEDKKLKTLPPHFFVNFKTEIKPQDPIWEHW